MTQPATVDVIENGRLYPLLPDGSLDRNRVVYIVDGAENLLVVDERPDHWYVVKFCDGEEYALLYPYIANREET